MDAERFEYAWRWFSLHASQRYSVFNYFMLFVGILANAFVLLMNNEFYAQAGALALVAALLCGAFVLLDIRNRNLVDLGRQILIQLEQESSQGQEGNGPLTLDKLSKPPFFLKHGFLLRSVQTVALTGFLTGAVWAFKS